MVMKMIALRFFFILLYLLVYTMAVSRGIWIGFLHKQLASIERLISRQFEEIQQNTTRKLHFVKSKIRKHRQTN